MNINDIKNRWSADLYDRQENHTDDVELLLSVIGPDSLTILEPCCGGGRILVPLARAGHRVTGFDADEYMLAHIPAKAEGMDNLTYYKADAIRADWGSGYDVAVLAGNILINIETELDDKQAQRMFIEKAAACLRSGGHAYLDFNLFSHPEKFFGVKRERVHFDGTDAWGVYGRYMTLGGTYDPVTRICECDNRTELTLPDGNKHIFHGHAVKHIPTLDDVHGWMGDAGFAVDEEYGDYQRRPIGEDTCRAIIYARKIR